MASIKIERLNHTYQEAISTILAREVKDADIKFVTVTGVEVTNDLSFAKVYYTVLDKEKEETKASSFIRTKLAEKVEVRHTPELRFIYDKSIAYGEHIDNLIKEIKEKE